MGIRNTNRVYTISFRQAITLLLSALSILLATSATADHHCPRLRISGNAEYPPFLWVDPLHPDELVGANAELMALLSKEIGIPVQMVYSGPWGRTQAMTKAGLVDMLAGAFDTHERRGYMSYISTPIYMTRSVIWIRDDKPIAPKSWDELANFSGITVINNSFGNNFDMFAERMLRIQKVGSLEVALRMLQAGRADYLVYEDQPAQAYIQKLGLKRLSISPLPISQEALYLTVSLKSPCYSPELITRVEAAMKKLSSQGVMGSLLAKYQQAWGLPAVGIPRAPAF